MSLVMFSLLMSAILMLVAITLSASDGNASAAPESAEPGGTCGGALTATALRRPTGTGSAAGYQWLDHPFCLRLECASFMGNSVSEHFGRG